MFKRSNLLQFKKFIQTNRKYLTDIQNGVLEALEIAWLNVQWHKHHYRTIETYFNEI